MSRAFFSTNIALEDMNLYSIDQILPLHPPVEIPKTKCLLLLVLGLMSVQSYIQFSCNGLINEKQSKSKSRSDISVPYLSLKVEEVIAFYFLIWL